MEEQKNRIGVSSAENPAPETIPSFLLKTYEILQNDKFSDIICWTKSGEGFIVQKVKEFSESILPIYFRHSNYTSFVRQLNMYDFHKTRLENHENAFKNLMFTKGYKHLLKDIQRKDYKKNKDNTKEPVTEGKNMDRNRDLLCKIDRTNDASFDLGRNSLKKMRDINCKLEKKTLQLAQLREIPQQPREILHLLDNLFDAKKLHFDLITKMDQLGSFFKQLEPLPKKNLMNEYEQTAQKNPLNKEFPTADPKETGLDFKSQEAIGTKVSLFSSFNQ